MVASELHAAREITPSSYGTNNLTTPCPELINSSLTETGLTMELTKIEKAATTSSTFYRKSDQRSNGLLLRRP